MNPWKNTLAALENDSRTKIKITRKFEKQSDPRILPPAPYIQETAVATLAQDWDFILNRVKVRISGNGAHQAQLSMSLQEGERDRAAEEWKVLKGNWELAS